jgi:hypothetical protein
MRWRCLAYATPAARSAQSDSCRLRAHDPKVGAPNPPRATRKFPVETGLFSFVDLALNCDLYLERLGQLGRRWCDRTAVLPSEFAQLLEAALKKASASVLVWGPDHDSIRRDRRFSTRGQQKHVALVEAIEQPDVGTRHSADVSVSRCERRFIIAGTGEGAGCQGAHCRRYGTIGR